jgi:diguanylate cyclase
VTVASSVPRGLEEKDRRLERRDRDWRSAAAIVASLTSLAHNLGVFVIAEGVESPEQAGGLLAVGCDMGQGLYWSPALPAQDLEAHLATIQPAKSP